MSEKLKPKEDQSEHYSDRNILVVIFLGFSWDG